MMNFDYESLLKSALEKVPKKEGTGKRFKIPQVVVESQGPKTVIKNFGEISSSLRRDPKQIAKFISKEVAAPGNVQNDSFVIQMKVSRDLLQKKLEDYIKEFVYCKVCGEPDTKIEKEGRINFIKCEACGARSATKQI
jgi:translation initiation factor 2 subunit 2